MIAMMGMVIMRIYVTKTMMNIMILMMLLAYMAAVAMSLITSPNHSIARLKLSIAVALQQTGRPPELGKWQSLAAPSRDSFLSYGYRSNRPSACAGPPHKYPLLTHRDSRLVTCVGKFCACNDRWTLLLPNLAQADTTNRKILM